ncbi:uncharacterized protein LOC122067437 [Macadamia integrifolia]|uniref:uncharacterized protein LOC122067437 n=1 Tax=Macadamia integrifolia TaxID=60698 RepID=UPI001C4FE071|nr:uncharacterized protein LOC122067437 [Macadamia integrifolia]
MEARSVPFPSPFSLTISLQPLRNPNFSPTQNPSTQFRCYFSRSRGRSGGAGDFWDSNAEDLRSGRFKFRYGEESMGEDEEDGDYEEDVGFRTRRKQKRNWWSDNSWSEMDQEPGVLEEAIDSIWILKVIKSFGWMLPAIILSMLLETGPKAFLMALALPLGQSLLFLAIDKVWGMITDSRKPRYRNKKKPFSRNSNRVEKNEEAKQEQTSEATEEKWGYQSWVETNDGSAKGSEHAPSFGGWDDLDRRGSSAKAPPRRPPQTPSGPLGSQMKKKGKFSRRNRDTPLLLRLLIAVFPFLGSWTRML